MHRRTLLLSALSVSAVTIGGGVTWLATCDTPTHPHLSIDNALDTLDTLKARSVLFSGDWNAAQVFTHCAQSVEMSMSGYPEHRSQIFKMSVGRSAYAIFAQQGKMQHTLNEPIPGAPALDKSTNTSLAIHRLAHALRTFKNYRGQLEPHFAYGYLSKREYALAHVMHLQNHLQELRL